MKNISIFLIVIIFLSVVPTSEVKAQAGSTGCISNLPVTTAVTLSYCYVDESPGWGWDDYVITYHFSYNYLWCGPNQQGGYDQSNAPQFDYDSPYTSFEQIGTSHTWPCQTVVNGVLYTFDSAREGTNHTGRVFYTTPSNQNLTIFSSHTLHYDVFYSWLSVHSF